MILIKNVYGKLSREQKYLNCFCEINKYLRLKEKIYINRLVCLDYTQIPGMYFINNFL